MVIKEMALLHWVCILVTKHFTSMCKVLDLILNAERKIKLESMNIIVVELEFEVLALICFHC